MFMFSTQIVALCRCDPTEVVHLLYPAERIFQDRGLGARIVQEGPIGVMFHQHHIEQGNKLLKSYATTDDDQYCLS